MRVVMVRLRRLRLGLRLCTFHVYAEEVLMDPGAMLLVTVLIIAIAEGVREEVIKRRNARKRHEEEEDEDRR